MILELKKIIIIITTGVFLGLVLARTTCPYTNLIPFI